MFSLGIQLAFDIKLVISKEPFGFLARPIPAE
jgi:hypothetical protein